MLDTCTVMMVNTALLRISVTCNCPEVSLTLYDDWLKVTVTIQEDKGFMQFLMLTFGISNVSNSHGNVSRNNMT